MIKILLALLVLLPLQSAFASPAEFRAAGLEIPQNLQARGYSRFGNFDLATLISQMQGIRIEFTSDLSIAKRNQNGRISARWEVTANGRIIRVYAPSWAKFTEQRSMLALHEYLGILGYGDNNYWLSTQMWTLSLQEASALSSGERAEIERSIGIRAQPRMQMAGGGGGVVGVGGGGEGGTIWVRQRRIKEGLNKINEGRGDRDEALGKVYHELEGTVEAGYSGFESPAVKKAAREMTSARRAFCMVSAGLCKTKPQRGGANSCTCRGQSDPGVIIYTENPWSLLD